ARSDRWCHIAPSKPGVLSHPTEPRRAGGYVMPRLNMSYDVNPGWAVLPWLTAALLALAWLRQRSGPAVTRSHHAALWVLRGAALAVLVAIGLNPVHVSVTPGSVRRPEVHVLLDASQSMKLGSPDSRWQEGTALLRDALERQKGHAS